MNKINTPEEILLVSSRSDPAGTLIHEEVKKLLAEHPELSGRFLHRQFDERLIYLDGPSLATDADCIIFLSRHASKEPRPVLTVHVTGNFGPADFGGTQRTLTGAATGMMHAIMNQLAREVPDGYAVTYEATHHGPTKIPVPSCFVEVGSTEVEWQDRNAAAAVARAVISAIPEKVVQLTGFGGTHYAKRQTEITLTTRGGFGHIMPSRDLIHLDQELFTTIVRGSGAEAIYIDRKAVTKDDIRRIEGYAGLLELPVVGQSDLLGLKDLSFAEYKKIITIADRVLPGSSITLHALHQASNPVEVVIPAELLAEASKVNPNELSTGLSLLPVAHLSGNGVAFYHIFITDSDYLPFISGKIIDLCVSIISAYYGENVSVSHDNPKTGEMSSVLHDTSCILTITERKFSPQKAADLGIMPGKDFGRLAGGETLTLGDQIITPDQVVESMVRQIRVTRDT